MTSEEDELCRLWLRSEGRELRQLYGEGMIVAVADRAVIEWGSDEARVRERAERMFGAEVFVGVVRAESEDIPADIYHADADADWQRFRALREQMPCRRRYLLNLETYDALGELNLIGHRTELDDGVPVIDGTEVRWAEHDYRVMVEHGLVPADTELIAGVLFRARPRSEQTDDRGLLGFFEASPPNHDE